MAWKFDNERSIYLQLVEQIQNRIITGAYPPGSKLASVRDLAAEAEVNPNTMQKALTELEHMGLVHAVRTIGRFVTEDMDMITKMKYQSAAAIVEEFKKKMEALGFGQSEIVELVAQQSQSSKEAGES
ncbi:MAG: GntR family transcriptional regulator [Eubacterium sp.]|nr:GntR family transcriptional regulator [Eubacterium sp.]